jgi:hypothetical protein
MARRLRREFQKLEALLEPNAVEKQWQALIDLAVNGKGDGPHCVLEQIRLRERLRSLNARRDRYNHERHKRRHMAFMRLIQRRHVLAVLAIRSGLAVSHMTIRDMMIGALGGDRRLSLRWLEELETVHETLNPSVKPWEVGQYWIEHLRDAKPAARAERSGFEEMLKPTPVPDQLTAAIPYGFRLPQTSQSDDNQIRPPASQAVS